MKRLLPIIILVCAGWPAGVAGEDEPPPGSPFAPKPEKRPHQRWGYVVMSDGTRHEGLVSTTAGRRLRILDRKKNAYRDLKWKKIERIGQTPEKQWLEREWRWKQAGSDEKVFTDRYYRAAKYRTTIVLKSGEKIVGDAVAPIYVQDDEKLHRLELHKRFKNPEPAPKEELKPLFYIKELALTDKPPEEEKKTGGGEDD